MAADHVSEKSIEREAGNLTVRRGGFVRTKDAGSGIVLIKRETLAQIGEKFPDLWVPPSKPTYTNLAPRIPKLQLFSH
jgi:hypothetical protein